MTMVSFQTEEADVKELQAWADRLGLDRSELLREALRQHLLRLASERDAATWQTQPLTVEERSFADVADWGPAEDWADWSHADQNHAAR